jgi:sugar lactone lactonase YvrE
VHPKDFIRRFRRATFLLIINIHPLLGDQQAPRPVNDHFDNAEVIVDLNSSVTGSNLAATADVGEPPPVFQGTNSVWWKVTVPGGIGVNFNTFGSSFDAALTVFTGTSLADLVVVGKDLTEPKASYSNFFLKTTQETTYYLRVAGYNNASGNIRLNVTADPCPVLLSWPMSASISYGWPATNFIVTATNSSSTSFTYQWRKNGVNLPSETNAAPKFIVTSTDLAGTYDVVVSNGGGSRVSYSADLSITLPYMVSTLTDLRKPDVHGVAVDPTGNVFATAAGQIFKISPLGNPTLFASLPSSIEYLTADAEGNLYATYNDSIGEISSSGEVSVFAGAAGRGYTDGPLEQAQFSTPRGIAFDAAGAMYVSDFGNGRIRKIFKGIVTTLAGGPEQDAIDGPAKDARFRSPSGIAVDSKGNVYIGDGLNYSVRKISSDGMVTTIAGKVPPPQFSDSDLHGIHSRLVDPEGLAIDREDNLYVTESDFIARGISRVRKIGADGTVSTLMAWSDGDIPRLPKLQRPFGIAVDRSGTLYIASLGNSLITQAAPVSAVNIQTQPQSRAALQGRPVGFSVSVTSDPPISFQWTKDGIEVPGAISSSFTIPSVTASDAGSYAVNVSHLGVITKSEPATLTVGFGLFDGHFISSTEFGMTAVVNSGDSYAFESSDNLMNWSTVSSFTATGSVATLKDSNAQAVGARFYRLHKN